MRAVRQIARELGTSVFLVGGPLRDLLLGHPVKDIDLAVEAGALDFGTRLAARLKGRFVAHPEFGTGTVLVPGQPQLDVAGTRRESYRHAAALPQVQSADILADLGRRDFTVNALAWNLTAHRLLDPYDGMLDLRRRFIRVLHDHSFIDDPTRLFRALRFATRLGFRLEPATARLFDQALAARLPERLSGKRIRTELELILKEARCGRILHELEQCGMFQPVFGHRLPALGIRHVARLDAGLRWTCLCFLLHADASRLPLTREESADIASLRKYRTLRPRLSRTARASTIYTLLRQLTRTSLIIMRRLETPAVTRKLARYLEQYAEVQPLLRGEDLKALGIAPGPCYTAILDRLRAARLDGRVTNRADELELVRRTRRA